MSETPKYRYPEDAMWDTPPPPTTTTDPPFTSSTPLLIVLAIVILVTHLACTALIIHNAWEITRHAERMAPTMKTVRIEWTAHDMLTLTDAMDRISRSIRTAPTPLPGVPPEIIPDIIQAIPRNPAEIAVQTEAPRTELQVVFPDTAQWCAPSSQISVAPGADQLNIIGAGADRINSQPTEY